MKGVPQPTLQRLVVYYRYLKKLAEMDEEKVVCSKKMGEDVGTSSAQVRKDLSYFGEFGCKGVGYEISTLMRCLERILGVNKRWKVVLVGAGNLGRALVNYQGFNRLGIEIVEAFDNDLDKIGNRVGALAVKNDKEMEIIIRKNNIKMAILAVPGEEAQQVARRLVAAGIRAIWNFAPEMLRLPADIHVYDENLAISLVTLIYKLNQDISSDSVKYIG